MRKYLKQKPHNVIYAIIFAALGIILLSVILEDNRRNKEELANIDDPTFHPKYSNTYNLFPGLVVLMVLLAALGTAYSKWQKRNLEHEFDNCKNTRDQCLKKK